MALPAVHLNRSLENEVRALYNTPSGARALSVQDLGRAKGRKKSKEDSHWNGSHRAVAAVAAAASPLSAADRALALDNAGGAGAGGRGGGGGGGRGAAGRREACA